MSCILTTTGELSLILLRICCGCREVAGSIPRCSTPFFVKRTNMRFDPIYWAWMEK